MTRFGILMLAAAATAAIGARPRPAPQPPRLIPPIACGTREGCAIQSYVDHAPGDGVSDYMCRWRTYPHHNGTDFRIASLATMRAGVPVVASAAGRVLRVRDGVPDVSVKARGFDAVRDQECGNGVVIDDGHGFETQYCHMRQGSIRVRPGQRVRAGRPIGLVGLSGNTEFPHVHLTMRQDGQVIDPFAYAAAPGTCGGGRQLWRTRIAYQSGQPFVWGFADHAPTMAEVQETGAGQPQPLRQGPALVAFVLSIGLARGDVPRLRILAPDGAVVVDARDAPLDHDKAEWLMAAGRRMPPGGWGPGVYQAEFTVRRGGVDAIARTFRLIL